MHDLPPPKFDNSPAVIDALAMMNYAFTSDVDFETLAFAAKVRDLIALMLITSHEEKAAAAVSSPATTTAAVTDAWEEAGAGFEMGRRTNFGASENIASSTWHSASKLGEPVMLHRLAQLRTERA
jgi:hypothetical protein